MRTGVRLGVDVGKARIGLARTDHYGLLATPLETLDRNSDWALRLTEVCQELTPLEILVGLPINLAGKWTPATEDAFAVAEAISSIGFPVRLIDERLSTKQASYDIRPSGRKGKEARAIIDQAAAVVILNSALEFERGTDKIPGTALAEISKE